MPNSNNANHYPDQYPMGGGSGLLHANFQGLFQPQTVAAEVPAVKLTMAEWLDMQFILRELISLSPNYDPAELSGTLIQGAALNDTVQAAQRLRLLAGEEETE